MSHLTKFVFILNFHTMKFRPENYYQVEPNHWAYFLTAKVWRTKCMCVYGWYLSSILHSNIFIAPCRVLFDFKFFFWSLICSYIYYIDVYFFSLFPFSFISVRMHRKNGQFASLKDSPGSSNWDSAQKSHQDGTRHSETVWVSRLVFMHIYYIIQM